MTEHNYLNFIPLFNQKIYETLSNILVEKNNKNNLWDIKIGNSNNKTLKYIKQNFKNANISLIDIFYDSNNILKKKYQIPYRQDTTNPDNIIYNISGTTGISPEPTETTEKKYWSIKGLIDANNKLINFIIPQTGNPDYLNKQNVKNVLCCYIFFMINLFYDFYKTYIDKLNNIIINISSSKIGKDLNFTAGFNYIERLNISLLNFKKILLNNFYELFLPSSIINNNYGMILNKDGFYIPDGSLLSNNDDIVKNFPFKVDVPLTYKSLFNESNSLINKM
jgi:hypothetical protein